MKGIVLKPEARVRIDVFELESGNKLIGAYVDSKKVNDTTFCNILKRDAF